MRRPEGSGERALRPPAAMGRKMLRTNDWTARERSPSGPPHLGMSYAVRRVRRIRSSAAGVSRTRPIRRTPVRTGQSASPNARSVR